MGVREGEGLPEGDPGVLHPPPLWPTLGPPSVPGGGGGPHTKTYLGGHNRQNTNSTDLDVSPRGEAAALVAGSLRDRECLQNKEKHLQEHVFLRTTIFVSDTGLGNPRGKMHAFPWRNGRVQIFFALRAAIGWDATRPRAYRRDIDHMYCHMFLTCLMIV